MEELGDISAEEIYRLVSPQRLNVLRELLDLCRHIRDALDADLRGYLSTRASGEVVIAL